MRSCSMGTRILLLASLFFVGCGDKFPATYLYKVDVVKLTCDRFTIDQDNIKFKFDKSVKYSECPTTYGLSSIDAGEVMAWARRNQEKLKECQ